MPLITYDMELTVAFTFETPDAETGKRWLKEALNCVDINAGELQNGHTLVGEATLNGEAVVGLIDGEEPEDERYKPGGIYAPQTEQERVDAPAGPTVAS